MKGDKDKRRISIILQAYIRAVDVQMEGIELIPGRLMHADFDQSKA